MGTNSIQRVSATQGAQFEKFTKEASKDYENLIGNILNGTITTEEQRERENFRISNKTFEVLSDEYRTLADKKNKTPEEIQKLDTEYNTNIQKLGNSMTKYISETFANGGDIDSAAFMQFQNNGAMNLEGLTAEDKSTLETSNQIAFNRIDVNGDGKIDNKEMTAFMHALDFDDKNRMGGVIKAEDYYNCASQLDDPNQNLLDTKINYCYNKLYGNEEE